MDQKELFERLEELELEDFEVKETKTSIPKSSFEMVSAFSNTNGWKAYYEDEPVSLNVVDFYKIASPLVKITKASEKTMEKVGEKGVEKDTINLLSDNERTVFEEMQAHPKVTANELSEILNINLRNTKKIVEKLKEKGLIKRIGSRKAGHWEVIIK